MKKVHIVALSVAGLVGLALAVSAERVAAHHSFSAEFDGNAPVILRGRIVKVEWVNPHAWIHLDAMYGPSETIRWMVEGGTPNTLLRNGLKRDSLQAGMEIVVRGYQSKDRLCAPACKANGRDLTFLDGRKLFMGSSGTGAPVDGSDPGERGAAAGGSKPDLPTTSTRPLK